MPIVNVRLTSVGGSRNDTVDLKDNIEIKSNFKIDAVSKVKGDNREDLLKIDFSFDVNYKPNVGELSLAGNMLYASPDLDKIAKEKAGKITLEPEVVKEVSGVILRESLLESSMIARKLRLPVPIRLPQITEKPASTEFNKGS